MDIGAIFKINDENVSAAVELLRKRQKRLCAPVRVVRRAPYRNIETLLLDDSGDAESKSYYFDFRIAEFQFR